MPDSLPELEARRSKILRQFSQPGDLRPGSICAVARRCGKPTCHYAKPKDAGHEPQMRLTRRVKGRTVAESFPTPAARGWTTSSASQSIGGFCSAPSRLLGPFLLMFSPSVKLCFRPARFR